jgi:hypothetical protein
MHRAGVNGDFELRIANRGFRGSQKILGIGAEAVEAAGGTEIVGLAVVPL